MGKVLVLQSFHEDRVTPWITACQQSVTSWCKRQGYDYRFAGDVFFDRLPDWYWQKVGHRKPIAADLARLLWIESALAAGAYDVVAWIDIDVFIIHPGAFQVAPVTTCVFGYEHWLQPEEGRKGFKVRKNVHNAYCAFKPGCPILPFLIEAVQRLVRRVDPDYLAPQFVGPKLLTSLHNIVGFELDRHVGAISPALGQALVQGNQPLVEKGMPAALYAANLCASLAADPEHMMQLVDVLKNSHEQLH